MAKLECELTGNFFEILDSIENEITNSSVSASKEDESFFQVPGANVAVRVYERYSMMGGNRVSLSITLFESANRIFLSAITAGGSQAVFWKVNTFGEEAFLDTIRGVVKRYII